MAEGLERGYAPSTVIEITKALERKKKKEGKRTRNSNRRGLLRGGLSIEKERHSDSRHFRGTRLGGACHSFALKIYQGNQKKGGNVEGLAKKPERTHSSAQS